MQPARRCMVVRGGRDATGREADELTAGCGSVLRASAGEHVRRYLGQTFDAVVLDLHEGLDADVLGQVHGLIRGGGALVLRMPPAGERPRRAALALHPYTVESVGTRFFERFERLLAASPAVTARARVEPPPFAPAGTDEQRAVVQRLAAAFASVAPSRLALVADRGRGKSAALGLALREASTRTALRVALTAPTREAAAEVSRFSGDSAVEMTFVPPLELVAGGDFDVVVVDEAAQLSVPLLRALVSRHPRARFAFATTTHGYEGTGRGFVLRFVEWLTSTATSSGGAAFELLTLEEPVRWGKDDPLERLVFDVLALDAEPSVVEPGVRGSRVPPPAIVLDRDTLAHDEPLLRGLFGLLLHAHYRTTPGDLERILDAPNLAVHAVVDAGAVIAATLVAREGGFSREDCEALTRGRFRVRGHALADTLLTHSARAEAGELAIVRSVRIATHPALRSRGLARTLVDHVHASYDADLFGTLFGATAELVRFRRSVGYAVARVGASRGARSGEPGVVMLRAASPRGEALLAECRRDLVRDFPLQRTLLEHDGELPLAPDLLHELSSELPPAGDLSEEELEIRIDRYLGGPQTFEAAAYAVTRFVREHRELLALTSERARLLLEGRVLEQRAWGDVAARARLPHVAAAMRAMRPAVAELRRLRDDSST